MIEMMDYWLTSVTLAILKVILCSALIPMLYKFCFTLMSLKFVTPWDHERTDIS